MMLWLWLTQGLRDVSFDGRVERKESESQPRRLFYIIAVQSERNLCAVGSTNQWPDLR